MCSTTVLLLACLSADCARMTRWSLERARGCSALAYGSRSTAAATAPAPSYTTSGDATGNSYRRIGVASLLGGRKEKRRRALRQDVSLTARPLPTTERWRRGNRMVAERVASARAATWKAGVRPQPASAPGPRPLRAPDQPSG